MQMLLVILTNFVEKICIVWSWCHIMTPGDTSALFFVLPLNVGEGKVRPALTSFHPSNGSVVTKIPPFH